MMKTRLSGCLPQLWLGPLMWATLKALCLILSHFPYPWQNDRLIILNMQGGGRPVIFKTKAVSFRYCISVRVCENKQQSRPYAARLMQFILQHGEAARHRSKWNAYRSSARSFVAPTAVVFTESLGESNTHLGRRPITLCIAASARIFSIKSCE